MGSKHVNNGTLIVSDLIYSSIRSHWDFFQRATLFLTSLNLHLVLWYFFKWSNCMHFTVQLVNWWIIWTLRNDFLSLPWHYKSDTNFAQIISFINYKLFIYGLLCAFLLFNWSYNRSFQPSVDNIFLLQWHTDRYH